MRANDRIKEQKLEKKTHDLSTARKDVCRYKQKYDKLIKLPKVYSESLNVSINCNKMLLKNIRFKCLSYYM